MKNERAGAARNQCCHIVNFSDVLVKVLHANDKLNALVTIMRTIFDYHQIDLASSYFYS